MRIGHPTLDSPAKPRFTGDLVLGNTNLISRPDDHQVH
jgi:hypothetical protein